MRIVIFVVLGLLVAIAGGVTFFPMSMAADMAAKQLPDFRFGEASGSVWDGRLTKVSYGAQSIGDLSVKTDLFALFGGKAAGTLGLVREGLSGKAGIAYGLGGDGLDLKDLEVAGDTASVPGMPASIMRADGKFTLNIKDVKFAGGLCESASGEVWTDALTKLDYKGWVGPELRGPVTCEGGKLHVQASGKAATGEEVVASLNIGQRLDMEMTAVVDYAGVGATDALTSLGFVPEGHTLVLRHALGAQ